MPDSPSLLPRLAERPLVDLLIETYQSWRADRAIRLGAGLAYYAVFAAVPVLTISVAVAGLVFSETEIRDFLTERITTVLENDIGDSASELAESIDAGSTVGGLGTFGLVSGLFAASVLFLALQDAFNVIWDLPVERGLRQNLRRRLVSLATVLLMGGLLLALLLVQTILVVVEGILPGTVEGIAFIDELIFSVTTWALGTLTVAALFQLLVRHHLSWRPVLQASTLTTVFMVLGNWALGFYFDRFGSISVGGLVGSLLVILGWLFYLAQIVIGGAELLKTLDDRSRAPG